MENFGKTMAIILSMIIAPIINGFVFFKLWAWFIVPTFQMQPLRLIEAIGIIFFINFIRAKRSKKEEEEDFDETFKNSVIFIVLLAAFTLLGGWIISLFF